LPPSYFDSDEEKTTPVNIQGLDRGLQIDAVVAHPGFWELKNNFMAYMERGDESIVRACRVFLDQNDCS